jgi:hypothetical protein
MADIVVTGVGVLIPAGGTVHAFNYEKTVLIDPKPTR